jgi:hypothetical protein
MSFKRVLHPLEFAKGEKLTSDLVGIGIRLAAPPSNEEPNIEDTLVAASIEGIVSEDFRTLALLVDWLGIHVERVNVDRLTKVVAALPHKSVKAFWAGVAHWQSADPRMKKLLKLYRGPRKDLMPESGDFLIQRNGEDERFSGSPFRVGSKSLRKRPSDVLSPHELSKKHSQYRWRVIIGPTYRADMWALLEAGIQSASELARRCYGSWPTATYALRDWREIHTSQKQTLTDA